MEYPKLKRIYEDTGLDRQELVKTVMRVGKLVEPKTKVNIIHEDPVDNKFIECATAGNADYIVSGDKHLLKLERYDKTQILQVSELLKTSDIE